MTRAELTEQILTAKRRGELTFGDGIMCATSSACSPSSIPSMASHQSR
jgi:hypothetical protein